MSNRNDDEGPPNFGLPQHSSLTIEGRLERAGDAASHVLRRRDGRERPLWSSNFAMGLVLIAAVLAAVIGVAVLLSLLD